LLRSANDGDSWATWGDLTNEQGSPGLLCCKESGSFLYVGTDQNAIARGTSPHFTGDWTSGSVVPSNVNDLETFGGHLYAACDPSGSVYRTSNGVDWTHVTYGPATVQDKGGFALKEFDGYLYAAGDSNDNIIRSSDGITWESAPSGLGTAGLVVGYKLESHNGYLYATNSNNQLVRSSDGARWDIRYVRGFLDDINTILSYNGTLYLGLANGELWSSNDDGGTFGLYQIPGAGEVLSLSTQCAYAFCGNTDPANGKIYKWGGAPTHYMITYDGTNFSTSSATSPANTGDTIVSMLSYDDLLYATIINDTEGYIVRKYDGTSWSTYPAFATTINAMHIHGTFLVVSLDNGEIYYLNTTTDKWVEYLKIPDLPFTTTGVQAFASYAQSPLDLYSFVERAWYSSDFIEDNTIHYAITGAGVSGSSLQRASIPGYRKQLDFMLDAAVHGGTHQAINRMANAFTLVNPDIRNSYITPQWKLKSTTGPIESINPGVWRFTDSPSWRDNLWQGSHATFTSGSTVANTIAVGYVILVNDNNTVDVGPIYDPRLLMDLTRIS